MDDSTTPFALIAIILWIVVGGFVGISLAEQKGRSGGEGFFIGAFLGIIGWVIILLLPEEGPRCWACKGVVPEHASKCRHCAEDLAWNEEMDYTTFGPKKMGKPDGHRRAMTLPTTPAAPDYIDVACPHCETSLSVKRTAALGELECPMCDRRFALKKEPARK